MNHIFSRIWDRERGLWVVASELAKGRCGRRAPRRVLAAGLMIAGAATSSAALASQVVVDDGQTRTVLAYESLAADSIFVGLFGQGTLVIREGATVTSNLADIGVLGGSHGIAELDGGIWHNAGQFTVGDEGVGELDLHSGATLTSGELYVGAFPGGQGVVRIEASSLTAGTLQVGGLASDSSGTVWVTGGGRLSDTYGLIGCGPNGPGVVVVSGGGSTWNNVELAVGWYEGPGTVYLEKGGALTSQFAYIGGSPESGSGSGTVEISDAGSSWTNDGDLVVAYAGDGHLSVRDGGRVATESLHLATTTGAPASDADVNVSGAGSRLDVVSDIVIGNASGWGAMQLIGGATVSAGGHVLLENGSILVRGGTLEVGGADGLQIGEGGELSLESGMLRIAGSDFTTSSDAMLTGGDDTPAFRIDTNGFTATWAGALGGTGSLDKVGAGELILTGDNTWSGETTIEAGRLTVGVDGIGSVASSVWAATGSTLSGSGTVFGDVGIATGATLSPGGGTATARMTVTGSMALSKDSRLVFAFGAPGPDFHTYGQSDGVTVGGDLALNGATLDVVALPGMGPGLYNLFSWGGSLSTFGGGLLLGATPAGRTLTLQTLAGDRRINLLDTTGMVLQFWNADGTASPDHLGGGSGTWSLAGANWTDALGSVTAPMQPQPGFAIFGGAAGTVVVDAGAGRVAATGIQFASDGYRIEGGPLILAGQDGTTPVIRVGDGSDGSAAWAATIDSALQGTAGLHKTGAGTLVLSGANAYGGGTLVTGGTLSVDRDDELGAGAGDVRLDGGALRITGTSFNATDRPVSLGDAGGTIDIFDLANTFTIGNLSGTGELRKDGDGTLVFNAGGTGFTGTTQVLAGSLIVGDSSHPDSALAGMVTVDAGALIGGYGHIGELMLSGTISPGNSLGTLHVDGNATFLPGSIYVAETDASGNSDHLAIGGDLDIRPGSTLSILSANGNWRASTTYSFLDVAGSVAGTFDQVVTDMPFLDPGLVYGAGGLSLVLRRNDIDFASIASTPNQSAAAHGIQPAGMGNAAFDALLALDADGARDALDQLSGELHASIRGRLLSQIDDFAGGDWSDPDSPAHSFWMRGTAGRRTLGGNANAAEMDSDSHGVEIGSTRILGAARLGFSAGRSRTSMDVDERGSSGDIDTTRLATTVSIPLSAAWIEAGLAYARHRVSARRDVAFDGFSDLLQADYDATSLQAFARGVLPIDAHAQAYVEAAWLKAAIDGFAESGGAAALRGDSDDARARMAGAGVRAHWPVADGRVALHADIGWRREWAGTQALDARLEFDDGARFEVGGVALPRGRFHGTFGLDARLGARGTLRIVGETTAGSDRENEVRIGYAVRF